MFKVTRGYVLATTLISEHKSNEMPYPVYSSQTKDNGLMGFYKDYLYENAITWTTDGANAGTVNYRSGKFYCTNVCGVLLSNTIIANQMIAEALNNVAKRYVSYVGNPKLMNNVMENIEINIPSNHQEREKISLLFQKLDELINVTQCKLERLKKVKLAMLQKMFPNTSVSVPGIRFCEFKGAWELCKFSDIGSISMCKRIFKNETSDNGDIPFYKIGTFGDEPDAYINKELFEKYKANFSYPQKGDILLSASGTIGRIVEYDGEDAYFQDSNIIWLSHNNSISNKFLKVLYPIVKWSGIEGSTIQRLYNNNFLQTEFMMPALKEQEKIGKCFKQIDNLINIYQDKLKKYQKIKLALLNKMFLNK